MIWNKEAAEESNAVLNTSLGWIRELVIVSADTLSMHIQGGILFHLALDRILGLHQTTRGGEKVKYFSPPCPIVVTVTSALKKDAS
jgi:hypothetical protein